jgi:hypothetical protein
VVGSVLRRCCWKRPLKGVGVAVADVTSSFLRCDEIFAGLSRIMLIRSRGGFPSLDEGFDPCPDEVSSTDE